LHMATKNTKIQNVFMSFTMETYKKLKPIHFFVVLCFLWLVIQHKSITPPSALLL